jgi:hypothetical protein
MNTFNQLWPGVPPYPGFTRFIKPYGEVLQWGTTEMHALKQTIVPVFKVIVVIPLANDRIPSLEAQLYIKKIVCFDIMAQFRYHTEAMIK